MKIQTVRDRLTGSIKDKKTLLATYADPAVGEYHKLVKYALAHSLEAHIEELESLLTDVELCMNDAAANGYEKWDGDL